MESRFAHLRQRDSSVSMLRVKLSRRRSQSQKENRDRAVNTRRQLEKLQELESSSNDVSIMMANMSTIQEKTQNAKPAKNAAVEERIKQLERWKERKALEKEKEKREKERKGVFKVGLYHPAGVVSLPPLTAASTRAKEAKLNTAVTQSSRVTRSMKQQQIQKPLKDQERNPAVKKAQPAPERSTRSRVAAKPAPAPALPTAKVYPVVRGLSTRSAAKLPVTAAPAVKEKPTDVKTTGTRGRTKPGAPSSGRDRNCKGIDCPAVVSDPEQTEDPKVQEAEQEACPSGPRPCAEEKVEEEMAVDQPQADPAPASDPGEVSPSFAPQGFVFQAPNGLSSFRFEPLTPRSADAFLTPSPSFNAPTRLDFPCLESQPEQSEPSPAKSPPGPSPTPVQPTQEVTPVSPREPEHDVPYFRSQMSSETDRLTSLSGNWEAKVEDETIPEEMRDRMRTAVGQARLLMKERFNQFSNLVDDCELGRGEKITTCTDLQGFWDMVFYQVEDVYKKFDALREAEASGWKEEHKPAPRQRKAVKKAPAAAVKPAGTNAAAKSRLAAAKAAMKAKQQAEKASKAAGDAEDEASQSAQEPQGQPEAQPEAESEAVVVFDGGFFQVESPAKPTGSVRRSSRLSAAVLPRASPCSERLTPRRVARGSTAPSLTPARLCLSLAQSPGPALAQSPASDSPALQEIPGLDFERYLQPSQRCSMSPREKEATETSSPMAADVEMESPRAQGGDLLTHDELALPVGSTASTPQSPQTQTAASALLLFTPDLQDRIRQSVCPSDLMVFTPPSNMQ
ncbi:disks large-associated protein 5 [Genypterus blacodes]|uniref:disks large-associated protein 5 n=1 Tax=Genypterus blacodes TaxID=154954 RepID=UPI003F77397F